MRNTIRAINRQAGLPIRKVLLYSCLNIALLSPVIAGVENRPINTDDAYTLNKGVFTAALGAMLLDRTTAFHINLGYGLSDRLEFTADIPIGLFNYDQRLGDISIRPEFLFIKEKDYLPAMSLAYTIGIKSRFLKTGENSNQFRENDHSVSLQFSKDFDPLKCHLNIGYSFVGHPQGELVDNVVFYGFACEYDFNKISLMGELAGETNSDPNSKVTLIEGLAGLAYKINNRWALDCGIGAGLTKASPDFRATAGLTLSF